MLFNARCFLCASLILVSQSLGVLAQESNPPAAPTSPITLLSSSATNSTSGTRTTTTGSSTGASSTGSAQFPSLSGYSSCVSQCLALSSAAANCTSVVDVNCFCFSGAPSFTQEMVACVGSQCPSELQSAEQLGQKFCALARTSTNLTYPSTSFLSTTSTSSLSSSTTPLNSTSGTTSNPTTTATTATTAAVSSTAKSGDRKVVDVAWRRLEGRWGGVVVCLIGVGIVGMMVW